METFFQSSNGTIFTMSRYIKTDVPQHVLSRSHDTIPVGISVRVPGHGDWNFMHAALNKQEYDGLPNLLEHTNMLQYADSTKDPESMYTELQVAKWEAQFYMKQIYQREYCGCGQPHHVCAGICTYHDIS